MESYPARRTAQRAVPRLAAVLCATFALGAPSLDAAVLPYDLDSLVSRSELIVRGRVTGLESFWGSFPGFGPVILTEVTIEIRELWKGSVDADSKGVRRVRVRLLGGKIGDEWQSCPESPRFESGEEVVVFLRRFRDEVWTTGWFQGKYRVVEAAGRPLSIRGARGAPLPAGTTLDALHGAVDERTARTPPPSTSSTPSGSASPPPTTDASSGDER